MDSLTTLARWAEEKWDSRYLPVVAPMALILTLFPAFAAAGLPILANLAAATFVGAAFVGVWWFAHRMPRTPANKLGFAVAVIAEGERERSRVSADFVATLRNIFETTRDIANVVVLNLPRYHAQRVTDTESAARCIRACRARFLTFGTASVRNVHGKEFFILRLRGVVVHQSIPMDISRSLAREMDQMLPQKVRISCENDLAGFELASKCFADAAKFVIATAALLSHDFDLAERLLESLRSQLSTLKRIKGIPGVKALIEKLPSRLLDVYTCQGMLHHLKWRSTHDSAHLDSVKEYAIKMRRLAPDNEAAYLMLGIWHFVTSRNVAAALHEIETCEKKHMRSPVWRFSAAFLHAYTGDLERALLYYRSAFRMMGRYELPFEVEEFMEWVLSIEPDKYQLSYCLGLINLYAKEDYRTARDDFENFIELAEKEGRYADAVAKARVHLIEIEGELDANQFSTAGHPTPPTPSHS